MPKIEVEIKAQLEKEVSEVIEGRLTSLDYNSKAEWLREKIRDFLTK